MINKYYINAHGIRVVKCCASCKKKNLKEGKRVCTKTSLLVESSFVCRDWEMSQQFDKVGIGGGQIKKKKYLQTVVKCGSKAEALEEFASRHESIYYTDV